MSAARRAGVPDDFRPGPLDAYLDGGWPIEIGDAPSAADEASAPAVLSAYRLQDEADHRSAPRDRSPRWRRAGA